MPRKLSQYRAKRHFDVTPEPAPTVKARKKSKQPIFMVHKHGARRLHYDLRLEIDGVLASWAVPKGPSYNPSDRRLAVETEDHPLAYASFEGRIPEGEYGAGDSIIWDEGTYETDPPGQAALMRRKGRLVLQLNGKKLKGRWNLVRAPLSGKKPQWLLIKGRDELATPAKNIVAERPESVVSGRRVTRGPVRRRERDADHPEPMDLLVRLWPPMLATLTDRDEFEEEGFIYEVKYDGFRALAALSGKRLALQSRNARDLSQRFPTIAEALTKLDVPEVVLDGEIVALDKTGIGHFQTLQNESNDVRYAAFDILWLAGEDLRARPLEERRELLESVLAGVKGPIEVSQRIPGNVDKALAWARRHGHEGVMAKRLGSPYVGRRTDDWAKLKIHQGQEVVIVGYLPISTGARAIGALLAAVYDGTGFRYAGKIGTGFTMKVREELWRKLCNLRVKEPPVSHPPKMKGVRWVRPKLVAEVAFAEWTRDGKLRQPSFQGLRSDKTPEECVRERPKPVRAHATTAQ